MQSARWTRTVVSVNIWRRFCRHLGCHLLQPFRICAQTQQLMDLCMDRPTRLHSRHLQEHRALSANWQSWHSRVTRCFSTLLMFSFEHLANSNFHCNSVYFSLSVLFSAIKRKPAEQRHSWDSDLGVEEYSLNFFNKMHK